MENQEVVLNTNTNTDTNNPKKEVIETPLRKRFKDYMAVFYNNIGTFKEKKESITNKYAPKFWWNKFWKKMHYSDCGIFGGLFAILALAEYVAIGGFVGPSVIFLLIMSPVTVLFNLALVAKTKRSKRKLNRQMQEEIAQIKELYEDKAFSQCKSAAKLVTDLMIEYEHGNELIEFRKTHTQEEYKKYYSELVAKYEKYLSDNGVANEDHARCAFYENWYIEKVGDVNPVSHEERLAIAEHRSKVYKKKSLFNKNYEKIIAELEKQLNEGTKEEKEDMTF